MDRLINIDNGGTLTDICVFDGAQIYRTKTLTTPHDLSRCVLDGLSKVSKVIYGKDDLHALLTSTAHIRYSTTQGTNALVERKGPRLGLIVGGTMTADKIRAVSPDDGLYDTLVGKRVVALDWGLSDEALDIAAVKAVNVLTSAGANRVIVAFGGDGRTEEELRVKRILLRKFPQHLLGAVPVLYSHEIVEDDDDVRRAWTALFNAFLHPPMERFLYNIEHKLRENKAQNPLLIFRNDGDSARVAKTIAIKTYSSGPRGGMEGAKALAAHYHIHHLVTMDVGGTTTDIGEVFDGDVTSHRRGHIEGVEVSIPLCNVESVGVGGSSIIKAEKDRLRVGPESVGSAPGPACFGLGGRNATITDAFLAMGLLDPASYFGGEMKIDPDRARAAIKDEVAHPLGKSVEDAAMAMEAAWVEKIAENIRSFADLSGDTALAAFGGAGPFVVCKVADACGISSVLIPGLAAVFSAFGLGFSDIAHIYEAPLPSADPAALSATIADLKERARRGMFAEGFALDECEVTTRVRGDKDDDGEAQVIANGHLPAGMTADKGLVVELTAIRRLAHPLLAGAFSGQGATAQSSGTRRVLIDGAFKDIPVYRVEDQPAGATAAGPAVLEEAFFTSRIDAGWRFEINDRRDILLSRAAGN